MSDLIQLQQSFQRYLLEHDSAIQHSVIGTEKVSADSRLAIYHHAYRLRLLDALASTFPILYQFLGTDDFEALADAYITHYPSTFRSIRWYGDQLPSYLLQHPHYLAYPFVAELAQFEWTLAEAFDAADATSININDVALIPPDAWMTMHLHTQPAIRRLDLSWNVAAIWQAISDERDPPDAECAATPMPYILWRNQHDNQFCQLSPQEACAIDALLQGVNFGKICEDLCQWFSEEEAIGFAASLLKGWVEAGLITHVKLEGEA